MDVVVGDAVVLGHERLVVRPPDVDPVALGVGDLVAFDAIVMAARSQVDSAAADVGDAAPDDATALGMRPADW